MPLAQRLRAGEDGEHFLRGGIHALPRCGNRAGKTKPFFMTTMDYSCSPRMTRMSTD
jgi:hypothetical protein